MDPLTPAHGDGCPEPVGVDGEARLLVELPGGGAGELLTGLDGTAGGDPDGRVGVPGIVDADEQDAAGLVDHDDAG